MYIKNENKATRRLKTPEMDEYVHFNEVGRARVTAKVGEHLAEEFDSISIDEREDDGDLDGEAEADGESDTEPDDNDSEE